MDFELFEVILVLKIAKSATSVMIHMKLTKWRWSWGWLVVKKGYLFSSSEPESVDTDSGLL